MRNAIVFSILIATLLFAVYYILTFKEAFSSSPTPHRLSNNPDMSDPKFANSGEEILIMTQEENGQKNIHFEYISTPLNSWIGIYIKKEGVRISNFAPVQSKQTIYKTINLLGYNKLLLNDRSTLKYYIKFLDAISYQNEIKNLSKINAQYNRYSQCLALHKTTSSKSTAFNKCKSILTA